TLLDLDLGTPFDETVTAQVKRERSGGRARCGILGDSTRGREHPRLPPDSRAGAAADHHLERFELGEAGAERSDLFGRPEQDERGTEHGVSGERKLGPRGEDTYAGVTPGLAREDEHRLREADLESEPLHRLRVEAAPIGEDRELIPAERRVCEHVGEDVTER